MDIQLCKSSCRRGERKVKMENSTCCDATRSLKVTRRPTVILCMQLSIDGQGLKHRTSPEMLALTLVGYAVLMSKERDYERLQQCLLPHCYSLIEQDWVRPINTLLSKHVMTGSTEDIRLSTGSKVEGRASSVEPATIEHTIYKQREIHRYGFSRVQLNRYSQL